MWNFYSLIIETFLNKGILDEYVTQASVPLINYMVKAPDLFKQGLPDGRKPLEMILAYIAKCFNDGKELEQDTIQMTGVSMIISLMEHLGKGSPEVSQHIDTINTFYLQGLKETQNKDFQSMLVQGMMMNFWFD